jgi:hypothetical protein
VAWPSVLRTYSRASRCRADAGFKSFDLVTALGSIQTTEQRSQSEVKRDAVVWVIDNNSSADFNCKLVFTVNGGVPAGSISTYQLTKNLVDGNRARYAVANPGLNSAIYDSRHINCTIPPNTAAGTSSIMNLYWFTTTNP